MAKFKRKFEEKLVKSDKGYRIEGRENYLINDFEHDLTWMRYVNNKEIEEFLRRK